MHRWIASRFFVFSRPPFAVESDVERSEESKNAKARSKNVHLSTGVRHVDLVRELLVDGDIKKTRGRPEERRDERDPNDNSVMVVWLPAIPFG